MKVAIFDIDGTLSDSSHRLHFIQQKPQNWAAFFDAMSDDKPIPSVVELLRAVYRRFRVVLITGRPTSHLQATVAWLRIHNVPFDSLYMREAEDHRADSVVKPELFKGSGIRQDDVAFVVEDRPSMCREWRSAFGFTVLQLTETEF